MRPLQQQGYIQIAIMLHRILKGQSDETKELLYNLFLET